jgi:small Trp-rich protein
MFFVVVGVVILLGHFLGLGPMAQWNWDLTGDLWKFAAPFFLAGAWWTWSDASGRTKRLEMQREQERLAAKQRKISETLGAAAANAQAKTAAEARKAAGKSGRK